MIASQWRTKEIDGVAYRVMPLGGLASLKVAAMMLKMASPSFSDVAQIMAASKAINSVLEALASGLLEDLDVDVIAKVAIEFGRVTQVEIGDARKPLISDANNDFDEHFRGRFMTMLKWLAFAASVTYPFETATAKPPASADPPAAG